MKAPVNNRTRGFTIVELMMSLAVLAVGIGGIVAMQKVTAMTNMHAKSVAIATQIARSWQDQLLVDGAMWRRTTSINSTTWLRNAATNAPWLRPAYNDNRLFGAAFDGLGNPVADNNVGQAYFCVHLQLEPVVALTDTRNATVRATIRVLWPRAQGEPMVGYCNSNNDPAPAVVGADTANFHSIYQTIAIRVHP